MKLLENKVTLITGATRGIGKGIARKFAEQGSSVAFTYVSSEEKALTLCKELKEMGVNAKGYKSNAGKFNEAQDLIDQILTDFGQLDVLINNAGITKDGLLMRMSEENWDDVIDINLKSVFNLTKASLRNFLKQKSGSCLLYTSDAADED